MEGTIKGIPQSGIDHLVLLYSGLSLKARAQNRSFKMGAVVHRVTYVDCCVG